MLKKIKLMSVSDIILFLAIILVGSFNEYISCLISAVLLFVVVFRTLKSKEIIIKLNLQFFSILFVVLFYGLTCFWAVDSGMAVIGFLKFLPILLYLIILQNEENGNFLHVLPYFSAILVVISSLVSLLPIPSNPFLVAGRLAGFFEYPNTFALLILVSELLILKKSRLNFLNIATVIVLIGGLLYTGSRTVFVLFFISNFIMLLLNFDSRKRVIFVSAFAIVVLLVILIILFGKDVPFLNRFLNINFKESTFVGRILYLLDSFKLILKYPFGMGYMGYYYTQTSVQTGVYSVVYAHNDFLQLFLDIGFIPAGVFIAYIVKYFINKNTSASQKVIVGTFVLHTLFDFNFQFIGMFMLFILLTKDDAKKTYVLNSKKLLSVSASLLLIIINLYMFFALLLAHFEKTEISDKLYPFNTRNKIIMLEKESDIDKAHKIAEEILSQNKEYYVPYSINSKFAYKSGNFGSLIENKRKAFEKNPFNYDEYEEYIYMLINGIDVYKRMGDSDSIKVCEKEIISAYNMLNGNRTRLSPLGKMIVDQPKLEFTEDILKYIEVIKSK